MTTSTTRASHTSPRWRRSTRALRKQRIDIMVLPGAEVALERAGELEDDELAALRLGGGPWLLVECPMFAGGMGVDGQLQALAEPREQDRPRAPRALPGLPERP